MKDAVDAVVKQRDEELDSTVADGLQFNPETGRYEAK